MICPHCARSYDGSILFCPYDGARLLEEDESTSASFISERTMVASRELGPGVRVGEYRLEEQIGEGGMATVFRAVHPFSGKQVAIKVLHPRLPSEVEAVTRFIQEARAINQIGHRNIIDIISFEQMPDGRHFIVMEYLNGVTLSTWLEEHGALPLDRVFAILRALASALDAAHARGFLHRDLKPDNIFLERADDPDHMMVKLLDFGLAKRLLPDGSTDDDWLQTRTGVVLGTPDYMSPEQCRGDPTDHHTDLYSLGVIAYQMLTGELPFQGENRYQVMARRLNEPPPPPSHISPLVSPAFDAPLLRALDREPSARFPSAGAFVAALEAAAQVQTEATSGLTGLARQQRGYDRGDARAMGLTPTAVPMEGAGPPSAAPADSRMGSMQAGAALLAALDPALANETTVIRRPTDLEMQDQGPSSFIDTLRLDNRQVPPPTAASSRPVAGSIAPWPAQPARATPPPPHPVQATPPLPQPVQAMSPPTQPFYAAPAPSQPVQTMSPPPQPAWSHQASRPITPATTAAPTLPRPGQRKVWIAVTTMIVLFLAGLAGLFLLW